MNFQQFATTTFGTKLWFAIGRLPRRSGHALARAVVDVLHRRKEAVVYRTVYANQSVVLGKGATAEEIDAAVGRMLQHAGMVAFDMAYALARGSRAILNSIELGDEFWPNIEAAKATGRGVLICGAHTSAFNLGFLAFALTGNFPILVLSADMPGGGYEVVRATLGQGTIEETAIDSASLRKAIGRLRNGGVALTGVDWPVGTQERLPFFGHLAQLPTGYTRLAMSGNAVLLPLGCRWTPQRGYYATTCPPMELELTGRREQDAYHNSARVLAIVEEWIRQAPEQWMMYHRVWPDAESITNSRRSTP